MTKLKDILYVEKKLYFKSRNAMWIASIMNSSDWQIWCYQKALRKAEYYREGYRIHKLWILPFLRWRRKKNKLGGKLGFDIPEGCVASGLRIYHISPVVINASAHIGQNCIIVGNVCIGNVKGQGTAPRIGDNCMLGWGSCVLGDIAIASDCQIAASALVTKGVFRKGAVMIGVPAQDKGMHCNGS